MAARRAGENGNRRTPVLRYAAAGSLLLAAAVAAAWCYHRADHFLATGRRFVLLPGTGTGRGLELDGVTYASREAILSVFAADFGKSVYLAPLDARRRQLLAVDWVKDAVIMRRWPDGLFVRIIERRPVAFVRLPGPNGASRAALIDAEGVLLRLPPQGRFRLPVLTGVLPEQSRTMRRLRVERALEALNEAGGALAARVSEIDVSDPDNLVLTCPEEGRALALKVGASNFGTRLENFFAHYPEIRRRLPQAAVFDLRLDDRIIAEGQ